MVQSLDKKWVNIQVLTSLVYSYSTATRQELPSSFICGWIQSSIANSIEIIRWPYTTYLGWYTQKTTSLLYRYFLIQIWDIPKMASFMHFLSRYCCFCVNSGMICFVLVIISEKATGECLIGPICNYKWIHTCIYLEIILCVRQQ